MIALFNAMSISISMNTIKRKYYLCPEPGVFDCLLFYCLGGLLPRQRLRFGGGDSCSPLRFLSLHLFHGGKCNQRTEQKSRLNLRTWHVNSSFYHVFQYQYSTFGNKVAAVVVLVLVLVLVILQQRSLYSSSSSKSSLTITTYCTLETTPKVSKTGLF